MDDDPSSVINTMYKDINGVLTMETLDLPGVHHRTPSDLENNNNFDISTSSSDSITKMNADLQHLKLGENKDFVINPDITVSNVTMPFENVGNDSYGYCSVIVNIIDDEENVDVKILSDEESKDGSFSQRTPDSRPQTPRSKSNSLNSDQILSSLR